ncbi:MAG: hypothetical protein Q4P06_03105 [Actinomycetaceae bacterium]|nr:hypothetical protein [Actinomycetaceae bacterium]
MTAIESWTLFGDFNLLWFIVSAAGGFFAAAIGANLAFGFTGIAILIGLGIAAATGNTGVIDIVAFGPIFGPHVAFAGAAAAVAYAAKTGELVKTGKGKDLNTAMAGLGRPDVLLVGSVFGMGGYTVKEIIAMIPWFGSHTDAVALTVMLSAFVVRLMFGKTGIFNWIANPTDEHCWVPWQQEPKQYLTLGPLAGLLGATIALVFSLVVPDLAGSAHILPFAFSAVCIIIISLGVTVPVTHHITIIAGLAAVTFMPIVGENVLLALLVGTIFGVLSAALAEQANRLLHSRGDTHIDPPATAIWILTVVILAIGSFAG